MGKADGWVFALVISFLAGLCLFIFQERRVAEPMLDITLFKNPIFSAANLAALLNYAAQNAMIFLLPFYLQGVLGCPPSQVGLLLTASPLVTLLVAPASGALSDRWGTRWLAFSGQTLISITLFSLLWLSPQTEPREMIWRLCVFGLGSGLFQSPNNSAVMGSVPPHRLGIGSGVLATVRNLGMVTGVAVSSSIFTWQKNLQLALLGPSQGLQADMVGLKAAFMAAALLASLGTLASLGRSDISQS